jgi:glycine betaine/choline ABC-type transport system substrate-binding protein
MYSALTKGHVDVISGYATDGRIQALNLVALKDDLHFFPPYDAAPLMSQAVLKKAPDLVKQLETLAGRLSNEKMRELNAQVDEKKRSPREVARQFLKSEGL